MGLCCQQGLQESHLDVELSFLIVKSKDNISCKALVRLEKKTLGTKGRKHFLFWRLDEWTQEHRLPGGKGPVNVCHLQRGQPRKVSAQHPGTFPCLHFSSLLGRQATVRGREWFGGRLTGIGLQLIPFAIQVQLYIVTFLSTIIDNVTSGKQWKAMCSPWQSVWLLGKCQGKPAARDVI